VYGLFYPVEIKGSAWAALPAGLGSALRNLSALFARKFGSPCAATFRGELADLGFGLRNYRGRSFRVVLGNELAKHLPGDFYGIGHTETIAPSRDEIQERANA
jgi:hypothetical protein